MNDFSKVVSYLFHPLLIPLAGTAAFFFITPKFNPEEIQKGVLLSVLILTSLIPIVFFFLLKNIGWISSFSLEKVSERKVPLYIYILLNYIVVLRVIPFTSCPELYFFFVGIIGALIACLVLVYFKFKASMHLMGISGLTAFIVGLAFHYEINITMGIALLVLAMGLVATARLFLKAHNQTELWVGLFVGVITQMITFSNWL